MTPRDTQRLLSDSVGSVGKFVGGVGAATLEGKWLVVKGEVGGRHAPQRGERPQLLAVQVIPPGKVTQASCLPALLILQFRRRPCRKAALQNVSGLRHWHPGRRIHVTWQLVRLRMSSSYQRESLLSGVSSWSQRDSRQRASPSTLRQTKIVRIPSWKGIPQMIPATNRRSLTKSGKLRMSPTCAHRRQIRCLTQTTMKISTVVLLKNSCCASK